MAETITTSQKRQESDTRTEALYERAVDMPFEKTEADADGAGETTAESSANEQVAADPTAQDAKSVQGMIRHATAGQKAEIHQIGETSILRIEQLRAENVELKAETHRLRQEITRLRDRNAAVERTNYELDEKVGQLSAAEKQIAELQRGIEYDRAGRRSMMAEVRRAQEALIESEKRFGHTESQLRAICQERADRITALSEELKVLQRAKGELEQQSETLLNYRHRAMSCMQQLTEELKRLRKENREKSRRLSEARAVLQSIDKRLAESIGEPA